MPDSDDVTTDQFGHFAANAADTLPPSGNAADAVPPSGNAAELALVLEAYMAALQAGKAPSRDQLLAAHPELAAQLEPCLAGIEFVHRATHPATENSAALGEFRIVREIGRGGMGVVYEAEQTSLRRRVALKVLRSGAVADSEAMQRFRREAETVARLHHTNIVPIFAVGCERGVHYYAMQLIEGRSLADVLDESRKARRPLDVVDVVRWGIQAADALDHAHRRGVIHRDVKPSNLLIDRDGVIWLTDFGLAKHVDEVTLTIRGTIMGTPRYMSPEQAESLRSAIDHRTDVYSLGASLYEFATGRPLFNSTTPHGVVIQILNEEPARPRQVRPELPRDLETIIVTCLTKDPAGRYQTAQALADDLRAVLAEGPIKARRVRLGERVARYVRKRRKAIVLTAMAVAATVVMILGGFFGWRHYSEWLLGHVVLTNDGLPLKVDVLPVSGDDPIGKPFDLVTRASVSLPADDYRLRIKGNGLLGQTFRLGVDRGETRTYTISLDEDRLLGTDPVAYAHGSEALRLSPGRADLVEWTGQTLVRRDGATGKPIWDASRPASPWGQGRDPVAWIRRLSCFGDERRPGVLVQAAPDLDGDGMGDIVWAFRGTPSFLALSGKDGSLLWTYTAELDGPGGPDPQGPSWPSSIDRIPRLGQVLGSPSVWDADGDGVQDLIAAFEIDGDSNSSKRAFSSLRVPSPGRRIGSSLWQLRHSRGRGIVVVAVSGRTGGALWRYSLERNSRTSSLGFANTEDAMPTLISGRESSTVAMIGESRWWIGLDPMSGRPRGQPIDLTNGDPGQDDPGERGLRRVRYADLDGDGSPEVIALKGDFGSSTLAAFSIATGKPLWEETVSVRYAYPPRNLMDADEPAAASEWPLVADLDGDGRAEIAIPDVGAIPPGKGYGFVPARDWKSHLSMNGRLLHPEYMIVRLLDGATGQTRWIRCLGDSIGGPSGSESVHLIVGPDLDGDGTSEVVAASTFNGRNWFREAPGNSERPHWIYVDALSGKDGAPIWWWRTAHEHEGSPRPGPASFGPPRWWGRGSDGWPMLLIALGKDSSEPESRTNAAGIPDPPIIHFLMASTGKEVHSWPGMSRARSADLDGDGLDDLWGSFEGKLRAVRGKTPEVWRALGRFDKTGDLDHDGVPDVLSMHSREAEDPRRSRMIGQTAVARSGADGRVLWRRTLEPSQERSFTTLPLPDGDLDGDGSPELAITDTQPEVWGTGPPRTLPLQVLSGRSGRAYWSAGGLPLGVEAPGANHESRYIRSVDFRRCDPGGASDFLVVHSWHWQSSHNASTGPPSVHAKYVRRVVQRGPGNGVIKHDQTRLARVSGRDGRVKWDMPLVELQDLNRTDLSAPGPELPLETPYEYGDLDGDAKLDIVLRVGLQASKKNPFDEEIESELQAISLLDGKPLWSRPIRSKSRVGSTFRVGDLDGDGRAEVVLIDQLPQGDSVSRELVVLDGRDGSPRWTWRLGDEPERRIPLPPTLRLDEPERQIRLFPTLRLVDFERQGRRVICVDSGLTDDTRCIAILDAQGRERAHRDLAPANPISLEVVDLAGDGREAVLFHLAGRLRAVGGDLKDLWSWPSGGPIRGILPARGGQPATVVSDPMVGLHGATGSPRWSGHSSFAILETGGAPAPPHLLSAGGADATICREGLRTLADGVFLRPRGTLSKPRIAHDDPRWSRPLPWASPSNEITQNLLLPLGGLALLNVIIPLGILRLAIRRRAWRPWLLPILPILLAIPPAVYKWWPWWPGQALPTPTGELMVRRPWDVTSPWHPGASLGGVFAYDHLGRYAIVAFIVTTVAGTPIVIYALLFGSSLIRRRWKRLLGLACLTIIASVGVGAWWICLDIPSMLSIEHYSRSSWYIVAFAGAYVAGAWVSIVWMAGELFRLTNFARRRKVPAIPMSDELR
jgi:tRNA A-37 threonylcarbamoyl transferase component Bud32